MNLNGIEWLVEMDWKNLEQDWKCFDTVLKIWQKNTCRRAAFLEPLQAAIIFQRFLCIKKLILQENFYNIFRNMHFFNDTIDLKQSVENTLKVLGKSLKSVLHEVQFIINLYSFSCLWSPKQVLPSPKKVISPFQAEQSAKLPTLDTSTITNRLSVYLSLVCIS